MPRIEFVSQDIAFKLPKPGKTRQWIREAIEHENHHLLHLTYIFCSDDYLLSLNQEYLKHKTLTDIITFDHSETPGQIEGDIFISIDRVNANAGIFETSPDEELHRVLIHGVLHLIGYSDKTPYEKTQMRKKEDEYLSLRHV